MILFPHLCWLVAELGTGLQSRSTGFYSFALGAFNYVLRFVIGGSGGEGGNSQVTFPSTPVELCEPWFPSCEHRYF